MDTQDKVVEDIPPEIMSAYRKDYYDIDLMFVNNIAFLIAKSRNLQMIQARSIITRKKHL